ncbi:MAG: hypothetical protein R1F54_10510 [Candidatus Zeuxoniibacter abyssi]|nr:MAG: hypothetical protein R1F54_10510 [Candidatus Persebacteraceae bacterium AB1(2)]
MTSTLTVGAGFIPLVAAISVSVLRVSQIATVAMMTNVLITGVGHCRLKKQSFSVNVFGR